MTRYLACWALVLLGRAAYARPTVLVLPRAPETAAASGEGAVRRAGFGVAPAAPVLARLRAGDEAEQGRTRAILEGVDRRLRVARTAYVEQRYDAMLGELEAAEREALEVLSRPEHCPLLWEVEFQLGLGHAARRRAGDEAESRRRYLLALSLEQARRPAPELYPSAVRDAFARALADWNQTRRAGRLAVKPADAAVTVDCKPVVAPERGLALAVGPHVVRASAPGAEARAAIVDGDELALTLAPRPAPAAAAHAAGPAWANGTLRLEGPTSLEVIRRIGREARADAVLLVDAPPGRSASARLVLARQASVAIERPTAEAAVAAALGLLAPDGTLRAEAPLPPERPAEKSVLSRWWFWTAVGVGALAIGAGVAILAWPEDEDRVWVVAR